VKILGHVPRDDQQTLLRVSKRFYRIMDQCIGLNVVIGRGARPHGLFDDDFADSTKTDKRWDQVMSNQLIHE